MAYQTDCSTVFIHEFNSQKLQTVKSKKIGMSSICTHFYEHHTSLKPSVPSFTFCTNCCYSKHKQSGDKCAAWLQKTELLNLRTIIRQSTFERLRFEKMIAENNLITVNSVRLRVWANFFAAYRKVATNCSLMKVCYHLANWFLYPGVWVRCELLIFI